MKNNIILMILPPHSSHLTQSLNVGVFSPLKRLMASAIEPLVSTELHRILKAEWLSAFVEAHDGAFSMQNIQSAFSSIESNHLHRFRKIQSLFVLHESLHQ